MMRTQRVVYGDGGEVVSTIPQQRLRPGHLGTFKARVVCKPCNNGWMREAETAAFEVLEPILRGDLAAPLGAKSQHRIAVMASTIFAMIDIVGDDSAIRQADSSYIYENLGPPAHWHVYIGRCDAQEWKTRIYRHTAIALPAGARPNATQRPNSTAITAAFGTLFLHLVMQNDGPILADPDRFAALHGMAAIPRLNPISLLSLPVHDAGDMQRLADDFVSWNKPN